MTARDIRDENDRLLLEICQVQGDRIERLSRRVDVLQWVVIVQAITVIVFVLGRLVVGA